MKLLMMVISVSLVNALDQSESEVLLLEISQLWLTIRGFSTAGTCVELNGHLEYIMDACLL